MPSVNLLNVIIIVVFTLNVAAPSKRLAQIEIEKKIGSKLTLEQSRVMTSRQMCQSHRDCSVHRDMDKANNNRCLFRNENLGELMK